MCLWFGATLSGWRNSDGLCCELLVKISCVRLRGNLGLKRRHQLLEGRRDTNISAHQHCQSVRQHLSSWWQSASFLDGVVSNHVTILIPGLKTLCISGLGVLSDMTKNIQHFRNQPSSHKHLAIQFLQRTCAAWFPWRHLALHLTWKTSAKWLRMCYESCHSQINSFPLFNKLI